MWTHRITIYIDYKHALNNQNYIAFCYIDVLLYAQYTFNRKCSTIASISEFQLALYVFAFIAAL